MRYKSIDRKKKVTKFLKKYEKICNSIETLSDRLISLDVQRQRMSSSGFREGNGETIIDVENRLSSEIERLTMLKKSFKKRFEAIDFKEKIVVFLILSGKQNRNNILDLFYPQITPIKKRGELCKIHLNKNLFELVNNPTAIEMIEMTSHSTLDRLFQKGLISFEEIFLELEVIYDREAVS